MVDDDPTVIQVLSQCTSGLGRLCFATSGAAALRLAREDAPDLVLAGAADFIAKPVRPAIVAARVKTQLRLKLALDRLKRMATTDGLTQCANRRGLVERPADQWGLVLRGQHRLSILMLDVGHFKKFNDLYDRLGAAVVAAVVHAEIDKLHIEHSASEGGVGRRCEFRRKELWLGTRRSPWADVLPPAGRKIERLLAVADGALYAAKQAGRARRVFTRIDPPIGL